ncbi:hypothetical protein [Cohnella sp. AR92]|uniref:hypothetical protein n=1 Tax=Cohnella sp. AR92 TaxID=648716 RepID=UPI000F8E672C|nr:hypothetical protein [Cohnella sp. AR92]RUS44952.1 hypothetical protein ELR57_22105 [Cohnella sp. AR92]
MEIQMHQRYIDVEFTKEQVAMFTDIVESDLPMRRILLAIGQHADTHKDDELSSGISIKQLSEKVIINRKVQDRKNKKKFSLQDTYIERKHAERVVETLLKMSLCYYKSFHPTKLIFLSPRGRMVAGEIVRRHKDSIKTTTRS